MNRDDEAIEKIKEIHVRALVSREPETAAWKADGLPADIRSTELWPAVDTSSMSVEHQQRFERYAKAISGFFKHGNLAVAAREAGVVPSTFLASLKRCLTSNGRGGVVGWAGLLWQKRINEYQRTANPPESGSGSSGSSGSFRAFLKSHQQLKAELDDFIIPATKDGSARSARPNKARVFSKFKKLCAQYGVQEGEYPLCNKTKGRRSVERYVTERMHEDPEAAVAFYFGEAASRRMKLQTGRKSKAFAIKGLLNATIDAHRLDCHCTIELDGPAGPQPVLITRLWLITAIDEGSRGAFGFAISIREEVSASDVERAILSATTAWAPRELRIAGLRYADGAGLPFGVVEGLPPFAPASIRMDNAAVHFSTRIRETARRALGCLIVYIPVAAWWKNSIHERWHRQLESLGIQRITSSAGNSPTDPLKGNGMQNALKHRVRLEDIEELTDVIIANYNATPTEALGNRSPLDALRYGIASGHLLPRLRPEAQALAPVLGVSTVRRTVRGSQKTGKRPYVEIDKVRYTAPELSGRFELIGATLVIHVNERDMRFVDAYTSNGARLGMLEAGGAWSSRAHTREERKAINRLKDIGAVSVDVGGDAVEAYHDVLLERAKAAAEKAPDKINRAATVAARTGKTASLPTVKPKPTKPVAVESSVKRLSMPSHMVQEIDYSGVF